MKTALPQSLAKFLRRSYLFPLALAVVASLMAINELGFRQSSAAALDIRGALEKRATINLLLQQMLDAETSQRGYLLTGQKKYLQPYN